MDIIDNLKEIIELGTNAVSFVNEILELKKNNKKQNEDEAIIGSSGYNAQIGSSGDNAQIGSSGSWAQIGSSGYNAQIGSSGSWARIGSSGYNAQIGSSGDNARIGSSGYNARIGSSGSWARIGSSGDNAQIGSSGDEAQIESSGKKAVISAIGYNSIAKGKIGSWVTLAEYKYIENNYEVDFVKTDNYEVDFVKTEYIDGTMIKEDTFYTLYNHEFKEVKDIDNTLIIVEKHHKNIIQFVFLNNKEKGYIFQKDGVNSHGKTVKQAYRDWLFKTSDRDVSQYENINKRKKYDLNFWVVAYRTITGACSFGTENYLENNKDKYKDKMTLNEVITATKGQYGHNTFVEFFNEK